MDDTASQYQGGSDSSQSFVGWINILSKEKALLFMYLHIIIAAIFPLYTGAHASLRCPPSAAVPKKKSKGLKIEDSDDDDDDDDDELDDFSPDIQGLQPSDAITFPLMAGLILAGLYFLIKWLDDPKLISRILNWYFSAIGILGVGKLTVDFLNVITSFIFPRVWSTKDKICYIGYHLTQSDPSSLGLDQNDIALELVEEKANPLPGLMSSIKFPVSFLLKIWHIRALFINHLIFRGYIKNMLSFTVPVRLNHVIGFTFALITVFLYNILTRPWWLTNIIAYGFCYGTLQIMSPTTFWTGSLVLSGLFIYDITMVFYTPLMITVASSLDVPIKLIFPGPKKASMLGLGDIILPGIMIAIALRFDLYLHYLKKQRDILSIQDSDNKIVTKPDYIDATGVWGEYFWTSNLKPNITNKTVADGAKFNKVYFWASMIGYLIGLVVTLIVLKVFNHAQPALLYLVPAVLFSLWGTAWIRGEIETMWNYTEDGQWGNEINDSKKNDGGKIPKSAKTETIKQEGTESNENHETNAKTSLTGINKNKTPKDSQSHRIFLFSLNTPRKQKKISVRKAQISRDIRN